MATLEEEPMTGRSSMNVEEIFMKKVLDYMDEMTSKMDTLKAENLEIRDKFTKKEEDHGNLKSRYEYLEWKYRQTKNEVREFGAAKDKGIEYITKL